MDGGLFLYSGEQPNAAGPAGTEDGERDTDKEIAGIDLSGQITPQVRWFSQFLWNRWDGFLQPGTEHDWFGGFVGADYVPGGRWSYSLLYNYADADEFDDTDTIFEGIEINSLTFNVHA